MMYPALVVFFASLASPAANAFTSSPTLHRMNRYQSSSSLFSDNNGEPNVRFEKFPPTTGGPNVPTITFPLNEYDAEFLKKNTEADSVTIQTDFKSLSYQSQPTISDIEEYKNEFKPLYPGDDGFWEEFEIVVDAQIERRAQNKTDAPTLGDEVDEKIRLYKWPELWQNRTETRLDFWKERSDRNLDLDDVAQSVRGEFSNYHQQDAITKAISNMIKEGRPEFLDLGQYSDDGITPKRDFIDFQVRAAVINAWSLEVVARTNFYLKWYHGVPRPEEVALRIKNEDNTTIKSLEKAAEKNSDLEDIIKAIESMNLVNATDFTAYTEGSPNHPSFPAMHSAGSTCSFWFPALYNINSDDYAQLLRMDYGVAFARTVAGVHYPQDNLAGLNIGQRIVRKKLPEFLAENYGYDAELVRKRLDDLAFDWKENYKNANDTINEIDAKEFLENANEELEKRNKERIGNDPI